MVYAPKIAPSFVLARDTCNQHTTTLAPANMNGYPPPPGPGMMPPRPSAWQVHKQPDTGKEYYHNPATGETKWDKPEELLTDEEVRRNAEIAANHLIK